jgi:hypothetical protein
MKRQERMWAYDAYFGLSPKDRSTEGIEEM